METSKNPRNAGRKQKGYYQNGSHSPVVQGIFDYNGVYAVYGLANLTAPEKIEYIGITSSKLNKRYNNHISQAKHVKHVLMVMMLSAYILLVA